MANYWKETDIHKNLNAGEMFKNLWWFEYCFCCGSGLGDIGNPLAGGEAKELCLHSRCEITDNFADPLCGGMSVMCCITEQCQIPPMKDSPTCVCFGKPLAGASGSGWAPKLMGYQPSFEDAAKGGIWCCYMVACGVACHGLGTWTSGKERPLYAIKSKLLCIEEAVSLVPPLEEGVLCGGVGTMLCCWEQCQLPPLEGNPVIKCCGFPKKGDTNANAKPMAYGKPGQVEMS